MDNELFDSIGLIESYQAILELYMLLPKGDITTVYNQYSYLVHIRHWGVIVVLPNDKFLECEFDDMIIRDKYKQIPRRISLTTRRVFAYLSLEYCLLAKQYIAELVQIYQGLLRTMSIAKI